MKKRGRSMPQSPVNQQLTGGREQQVAPSHHFRNAHRRVIHYHRKLVGRKTVLTPHHKVSEILSRHEGLRTRGAIHESDRFPRGNSVAPTDVRSSPFGAAWRATVRLKFSRTTSAWLQGLLIPGMGGLKGTLHIPT